MTNDEKKQLLMKTGKEHGLTEAEVLALQNDTFFSELFSNSAVDMPDEQIRKNVKEFFDWRYPV